MRTTALKMLHMGMALSMRLYIVYFARMEMYVQKKIFYDRLQSGDIVGCLVEKWSKVEYSG